MSKYIHPSRSRFQNSFNSSFRTDSDSDEEYKPPKLSSFASVSLARREGFSRNSDINVNDSSFASLSGPSNDSNGTGGFVFRTNRLPINANVSAVSQTINSCPTSVFEEQAVRSTRYQDNNSSSNNDNNKENNDSNNQYNLSSSINTTAYHRPSSMTTLSTNTFKNQVIDSELGKYEGLRFTDMLQQRSSLETGATPVSKIDRSSDDSFNSNGLLSRSKERRFKRLFNVNRRMRLGPARRATSLTGVDDCASNSNGKDSNNNVLTEETGNEHNYVGDSPQKKLVSEPNTRASEFSDGTTESYASLDFEGLDPLQYLRKFNLPLSELPRIRKAYFEKCKKEQREVHLKRRSTSRQEALRQMLTNEKPEDENILPTDIGPSERDENHELVQKHEAKPPLSLRPAYQRIEKSMSSIMNDQHILPNNSSSSSFYTPDVSSMKRREALAGIDTNIQRHEIKKFKPIEIEKPSIPKTGSKHVEIWEPPATNKTGSGSGSGSGSGYTTKRSNTITVNDTEYEKIELLGRGGSSKVYKVKKIGTNRIYALKQVLFDEFDQTTIDGFKGEIDLLQRLRAEKRVVHLFDHQMDQGLLYLVMECGDFDLAQILNQRKNLPFDVEFVRYYTRELLKCVKVVHDAGIVHSDLKPANFVVVRGILKIIDFGIADAVPDHTVNIYRNTQIGTPNYMAPETLISLNYASENRYSNKHNKHFAEKNGNGDGSDNHNHGHSHQTWKVGKPSDIWSCGCIIYQMIYGKPPYAGFSGQNRLFAIMNPEVKITYPEKAESGETVPRSSLDLIRSCLRRDPNRRVTIDEALQCSFLKPVMVSQSFIRDLIKSAVNYGVNHRSVSEGKLDELTNDVISRLEEIRM